MTKNRSTESIYDELRMRILRNEFPADVKINQNALAAELNVSRTPVVKALHMLKSEGLLDNTPNRGFQLHKTTLREVSELFMLRQSLEMIASIHAAEYGTEEQFSKLSALFDEFLDQDEIDETSYREADKQFHRLVISMCDNALMHRINESMHIMERSFLVGLLRPPHVTLKEHLDIIDAFRSHDIVRAQEITRAHTEITKRHLQETERNLRRLGLNPESIPIQDALHK